MLGNFIIVFFCAICSSSELRNIAIVRMNSMGRKRDGVKRKDSQNRSEHILSLFLFYKVKTSLTWITSVFSCLLPKI